MTAADMSREAPIALVEPHDAEIESANLQLQDPLRHLEDWNGPLLGAEQTTPTGSRRGRCPTAGWSASPTTPQAT